MYTETVEDTTGIVLNMNVEEAMALAAICSYLTDTGNSEDYCYWVAERIMCDIKHDLDLYREDLEPYEPTEPKTRKRKTRSSRGNNKDSNWANQ